MQMEQVTNPAEVPGAAKVLSFLAEVGLCDALIVGTNSFNALAHERPAGGHLTVFTAQPQHDGPLADLLRHPKSGPFREWTQSEGQLTVNWNNMHVGITFANPATHSVEQQIAKHGAGLKLADNGRDVTLLCTPEYSIEREKHLPYKYW